MNQTVSFADEDVRRVLRSMSAEVQASLALSRATLQALAALSPTLNAAAEQALEEGDVQAAAEIFAAVLQEHKQNPVALAGLARCYLQTGDIDRALLERLRHDPAPQVAPPPQRTPQRARPQARARHPGPFDQLGRWLDSLVR